MVDCWEIMGRLAADDAFRKKLLDADFSPPYGIGANFRAAIPKADYDKARGLVTSTIADRPVSLFSLGELLYALAFSDFRKALVKLAAAITATGIITTGRDFNFYIALGAAIIDDQLRSELLGVAPFPQFDTFGFTSVQQPDRADVVTLIDPNKNDTLVSTADVVCRTRWHPDCFQKVEFWPGHTHPIANP